MALYDTFRTQMFAKMQELAEDDKRRVALLVEEGDFEQPACKKTKKKPTAKSAFIVRQTPILAPCLTL